MKISREVKTGIVVVVAVALFVWGFNFLKGRDIFSTSLDLYAHYDNVDGLVSSNPVQYAGFKIGLVRDVRFDNTTKNWLVHFVITNDDLTIPKGSKMEIFSDGLLGSKAVRVIFNPAGGAPVKDGEMMMGDVEQSLKDQVNAQIKPLKDKAENLVSSIDSVVTVIKAVFDKDARGNLTASFESVKNALNTFERTAKRLDTLVASEKNKLSDIFTKIQSIATNLSNNNENIAKAIANFAAITDSLAKANVGETVREANKAMADVSKIMDKINRGEGTMGMLINNDTLYRNLSAAVESMNRLSEEIQKYPGKYIPFKRGGKAPKLPGAEQRQQDQLYKEMEKERIKKEEEEHKKSDLHKKFGMSHAPPNPVLRLC